MLILSLTKILSGDHCFVMEKTVQIALSFIAGTLWGSFFYTLALRYAGGAMRDNPMRALFSRSKCPACGTTIRIVHLAPVIGYFVARRKCASCGAPLSIFYPLSELAYGVLAALVTWKFGITVYSVHIFLLAGIALTISIVDLKSFTIPNSLVIAFVLFSAYPVIMSASYADNLLGLGALSAVFIVILLIFPGSFGGGDVKFAAAIGLLSGLELSIVVLEISLITGAVIGVIYGLKTKGTLRTKMPFAPFLAIGLIVSLFYGREILLLYYRVLF